MLLRHSWVYLLARVGPGLLSFGSLVTFTHILTPAQYGVYAFVLTSVALVKTAGFGWLDLSLTRFYAAELEDPRSLLSAVLGLYLLLAGVTGGVGLVVLAGWPYSDTRNVVALAIPLLWVHAWFELNLKLYQSKLRPGWYGLMLTTRSLLTLVLGYWWASEGAGFYGPLLGYLVGSLLGGLVAFWGEWRLVKPRLSRRLTVSLAQFGVPLTVVAGLAIFAEIAEKYMISRFLGNASLGAYSAAQELTAQSLLLLMMSINLAGAPLVMRAYERGGIDAAASGLRGNASMMLAVGLPATLGIALLSHNVSMTLLGSQFRQDAAELLPWIAAAALCTGLRSYLFNLIFQIKKQLRPLVLNSAVAATASVLLGLLLIPRHGTIGAAWSALAAAASALLVSIVFGRRHLAFDFQWGDVARIVASTVVMGLVVSLLRDLEGIAALLLQIGAGVAVYAACLLASDAMGVRRQLASRIGSRFGRDRR